MFCPECGMRFVKTIERDGIKLRICVNGHEIENWTAKKIVKKMEKKQNDSFEGDLENIPTKDESVITSIECPFCRKKESVLIRTITFHADEGEVFLMKCRKCNKNFRSGSGGGRGA